MGMKGVIQEDHIPRNKYSLLVLGLPPMTFTAVSGLEETMDVVDLPDRTKATGGRTNAGTFTVRLPAHHTVEQAAMEAWYADAQAGGETYKRIGTFVLETVSGSFARSFSMTGLFPSRRGLPDFEMENAGEMAEFEWDINFDEMLPI